MPTPILAARPARVPEAARVAGFDLTPLHLFPAG
ncbi:hypothetical protein SYYSPA8_11515 [Streptomyces yaizuensis]|uniref:Uncharacterized protein n=1 Tax=Streptomyces yaizuensis TaxID=2989713 RepID=A0ABQ5NX24_9ACTN|nr:hypothetical protein SYYSPA8_11515 [Streptomyces sp. YSPA8]